MVNKRLRGGGWDSTDWNCRSVILTAVRTPRCDGFRVVKEVDPLDRGLRGGTWCGRSGFLSSSVRSVGFPAFKSSIGGFRVVKEVTNGQ